MDADDVIDSYVQDVARQLPPGRRNDVAYELRALLRDDLRARAAAAGRPADAAMALELVRAFGRPARTAVQYYRPFTIIEPSDTRNFVVAAVTGGFVLSVLLYPTAEQTYPEAGRRSTGATLGWLGVLVLVFGVRSLVLRYRPDAFAWKPRPLRGSDRASRPANAALALLWSALLVLYVAPGAVMATLTGGHVDEHRLGYSDSFSSPLRMPWLVGAFAVAALLFGYLAVRSRWQPFTRWARIVLTLHIGTQIGWHSRYGDIFADPGTDRIAVAVFAIASAALVLTGGVLLFREVNRVRPAPAPAL